ncbi:SEL1-like repeat protein, partial [Acinetobacter baumannii]
GVPGAQNRLAHTLYEGAGVEKNIVEAAKWRTIAKRAGVLDEELDTEFGKLSKVDRQAVDQAVSDWADKRAVAGKAQ